MSVTLEEAKSYLRVGSSDEDSLITELIATAEKLCMDVARLDSAAFSEEAITTRIAVLYAVAYLYERREDADYRELTTMLRNLLFGIRKEQF